MLAGPSGVGKGTLIGRLLDRHPELWLSVSATTRAPRASEQHGVHYCFISREDFMQQARGEGLLEWAEFAGNCYGTPREPVERHLEQGRPVLLEIELEGARQVRSTFPAARQIFIAPPSLKELERRIRSRGTEDEESVMRRLRRACLELEAQHEFDAVVINNELEPALLELEKELKLHR